MLLQLPNDKTAYQRHRPNTGIQPFMHGLRPIHPELTHREDKSRGPNRPSTRIDTDWDATVTVSPPKSGLVAKVNRTRSFVTSLGGETTLPQTRPQEMTFLNALPSTATVKDARINGHGHPGWSNLSVQPWMYKLGFPRGAANDESRSVGNFLEKQTKVPESQLKPSRHPVSIAFDFAFAPPFKIAAESLAAASHPAGLTDGRADRYNWGSGEVGDLRREGLCAVRRPIEIPSAGSH
jgi:hypothetical protein